MNWLYKIFSNEIVEAKTVEVESKINLPHVVLIHGANASSLSFNYMINKLSLTDFTLIEYSSNNSFYENLNSMKSRLKDTGPFFVIGHSLGGLYGLHLTKHLQVIGGVSISTPFKGSATAEWAKFLVPKYQLFRDIGRKSKPILEAEDIFPKVPWTQIVSTHGSVPWHEGPNDGVVTLSSMKYLSDRMEIVYVNSNHYEIMCSDNMIDIVKQRITL